MIPQDRIEAILARASALTEQMSRNLAPSEYTAFAREYADLLPIVGAVQEWETARQEAEDLNRLAEGDEPDMRTLARDELEAATTRLAETETKLQLLLLPRDVADSHNIILELRAGTGGDEAALFAGDLLRMYQRYSDTQGWKTEIINAAASEAGGYKEIIAAIRGRGVYARLKYESGVHRVQRVPATESSGRIHTSAATVAVLPEAENIDVEINPQDLRIDVFRASGAGGQHVNTTESAVRITHIPSGIVASQQDEKSQHKNRAKAMAILRTRLYAAERERTTNERAAERKSQVGTGDRSERIRTYNFPQGRVSDHRINLTLYKLDKILEGEALNEIIDALITEDQIRRLATATTTDK